MNQSSSFFPVTTSCDIFRANRLASDFIKQFNDLSGRGSTPRIFVSYDKTRNGYYGYYFEPNADFNYLSNSIWNELIKFEQNNLK